MAAAAGTAGSTAMTRPRWSMLSHRRNSGSGGSGSPSSGAGYRSSSRAAYRRVSGPSTAAPAATGPGARSRRCRGLVWQCEGRQPCGGQRLRHQARRDCGGRGRGLRASGWRRGQRRQQYMQQQGCAQRSPHPPGGRRNTGHGPGAPRLISPRRGPAPVCRRAGNRPPAGRWPGRPRGCRARRSASPAPGFLPAASRSSWSGWPPAGLCS